jgi:hypothetical protein
VLCCSYERTVAEIGLQFGEREKGERPPLEDATKQRLVKNVTK